MTRGSSTGSGLPSWARQHTQQQHRGPPTEDRSDSDGDNDSVVGDEAKKYSPVSKNCLASICIFGGDGNLAQKKILPTLFQLWKRRLMPRDVIIFGYARADMNTEQFRKHVFRCIYNPTQPQSERKEFLQLCHYSAGQFDDQASLAALLDAMQHQELLRLEKRTTAAGTSPSEEQVRMYYMAVPPFLYGGICGGLRAATAAAAAAAAAAGADSINEAAAQLTARTVERFVLEKPFGRDTESCAAMVRELSMLGEDEIYRIDHYLGKELVMNLLVLRFANVAFQAIWNRQHIKSVQVNFKEELTLTHPHPHPHPQPHVHPYPRPHPPTRTLRPHPSLASHHIGPGDQGGGCTCTHTHDTYTCIYTRVCTRMLQVIFKEDFGTEGRGGYFDKYGIIRDVMQNHLLQVMALVAMEQPLSFSAEHIGAEKLKVLQAVEPLTLDDTVTGQYVRCGKHPGYLEDPTIENKHSITETFATSILHIHNPRWDGVPFVLKAGKALTDRKAEVCPTDLTPAHRRPRASCFHVHPHTTTRTPPHMQVRIQFHRVPGAVSALKECAANELVVRLQPEETIYWKVINKVPGLK